jgi:hypothetical protein
MKLRTAAVVVVVPFLLAALALAEPAARAAVPAQLTHEGRLLDASGQPVSASQVIIYKIYDAATGGNVLWTETLTVPFDNGYFSVQLGTMTPISTSLLAGGARYLGVQVGADDEMTPREPLTSVPYALLASVAEDATGDIHPNSVSVAGAPVISATGKWVGAAPLVAGGCMAVNGTCGNGTYMQPTYFLDRVGGTCPADHPIFSGFKFMRCGTLNSSNEGLQLIMTCCALQAP